MNEGSGLFKASGIMAIVIGSLYCFGFIFIFPLLIGITLILGGVYFLKVADYKSDQIMAEKTSIIIWIVVFFIFGGVLTGVLAIIAYTNVSSLQQPNFNKNYGKNIEVDGNVINNKSEYDIKLEKLERLNTLKQQGLLSDEEFDNLKKELLNK